jgi:bifunctional oligoribonuclease and PAP phosphatase NrnA
MENEFRIINAVADKIKHGRSFLISAHVNLEGDALGSGLALYFLLKKLGKRPVICNNDPTPAIYRFLPGQEVIRHVLHEDESFDAALIADCSDSSRTGRIKDYLSRAKCIINIDHHVSNTFFGDVNWVDSGAGSACEMLYKLCRKFGVMDKDIALCLYTGIFTDTGKFTYASTTSDTHRITADLLKYKVEPSFVQEKLISACDLEDLVFIGRLMTHLKLDGKKKVCWCLISEWEDKGLILLK